MSQSLPYDYKPRGAGWILFVAIILFLRGVLDVIYGIAGVANSDFFVDDTRYIFSDLRTWGWLTLLLGIVELAAAYSVWNGSSFGRWFAIAVGVVGAIDALLVLPGFPFWSLCTFAISILVIYGMAEYGGQHVPVE